MNKKALIISTVVILLAGFGLGSYFYKNKQKQAAKVLVERNLDAFEREHSISKGDKNAKVTVVEFMDPECGSCRRFYPVVNSLLEEFAGKLRVVIRYKPNHKNSKWASRILEAARLQNKYWEVLDAMFKFQGNWSGHHNPEPEKLWVYLRYIDDLDLEKLKKDMETPEIYKIIDQDVEDGKKLGVKYTPTFFVNKKPLSQFGFQYLRDDIIKALE